MDINVEEYTSLSPVTVDQNATLTKALNLMKENEIRHLPVVKEGQVVGIVSERDLMANYGKPWSENLRIKEIMNPSILFAYQNDSLGDVAFRLAKEKKGSAIILDNDKSLFGIFTTTDA